MIEEHAQTEERRRKMNRTKRTDYDIECVAVDTEKLQGLLSSGRKTAVEIGTAAGARIQVGRRVLWNMNKIQKYLDMISE